MTATEEAARTPNRTDAVIALGRLSLQFGRVNRITFPEDGVTPESDTDHTVMLGLIACALAHSTDLDTGMVAQYALVHDLVEVYAGDTATLRALSEEAKADKKAREQAALDRIIREFVHTLPWLSVLAGSYEKQISREARFVRAVDKLMPKITHILNECVTLRQQNMDPVELVERYETQVGELMVYAAEFLELFELRADLVGRVLAMYASDRGSPMTSSSETASEAFNRLGPPPGWNPDELPGHVLSVEELAGLDVADLAFVLWNRDRVHAQAVQELVAALRTALDAADGRDVPQEALQRAREVLAAALGVQ